MPEYIEIEETHVVKDDKGRNCPLPRLLSFVGEQQSSATHRWTWRHIGFREPKKGEFYVSGALPAAYKAINDMKCRMHVVEPLEAYRQRTCWVTRKPQPGKPL